MTKETIELSGFDGVHSRKRTIEELEALAKAEWRKQNSIRQAKGSRNLQAVGTTKYDYPVETMPNVLTVVKLVKILKDMDDRLTSLEKATASIGTKSIKVMEKMLSRIGKNEAKLENVKTEVENRIAYQETE